MSASRVVLARIDAALMEGMRASPLINGLEEAVEPEAIRAGTAIAVDEHLLGRYGEA